MMYTNGSKDSLQKSALLQKSAPPQQLDELIQSTQECIHDVKSWMTHNKLRLNDKTEALMSYQHPGFRILYLSLTLLL